MFYVEVREYDEWKVLYRFSTIGSAIHRYMALIQKGEKARITYRDGSSVLHVPYMQNK